MPEVGDQLTVRDQADVEAVLVAVHGDVEPDAVGDRRHRDVRVELRAGEVQRLARSGDVRDHDVDRRVHSIGELESADEANRRCGDHRRQHLRRLHHRLRRQQIHLPLGGEHRLAAQVDALDRVGAVGREFGDDRRHAVRPDLVARLLAGADRHGHHRPERIVGERIVFEQVLAQCTRTHRHHDVVDRAAGGLLERLDVGQCHRAHREPSVRRDRCVPRGRRCRGERDRHARLVAGGLVVLRRNQRLDGVARLAGRAADAVHARGLGELADDLELQAGRLDRVGGQVSHRGPQQIDVPRDLLAVPVDRFCGPLRIRRQIGEDLEHDHARRAVDRRVVILREHRPSARRRDLR